MKKIFRMIAGFFKTVLTPLDRMAENFSRMPNNAPELPPLTNSGPLIENEEKDMRFIERNLSSKETWEENQKRAVALMRTKQEHLKKGLEHGNLSPGNFRRKMAWEEEKLRRFDANYGVNNHRRHNGR